MALTKIDDRGLKTPIDLLANEKIRFGAGNDLEIYNDSNGIIHNKTGQMWIQGSELYLSSDHEDGQEVYLKAVANGAVGLYYDHGTYSDPKFETTATGAKTTGRLQIYNKDDANYNVLDCYNDNEKNNAGFSQNSDGDGTIFAKYDDGTNNADPMQFGVLLRSDGDSYFKGGNVGIGTDDPADHTATYRCLEISGTTGGVIVFSDDEVNKWEIWASGSEFGIYDRASSRYNLKCYTSSGDVEVITGNLKVPLGKGIDFSNQTWTSTGNTNDEVLDHYEEGTFVPTLSGASSNPTQSYAHQRASFTRIGNLVHITVDVEMASSGVSAGSGNLCLSGLPWPKNSAPSNLGSGAGPAYGVSCSVGLAVNLGSNYPNAAYANDNDTYFLLTRTTASSWNYCDAAAITNGSRVIIGATYRTTG